MIEAIDLTARRRGRIVLDAVSFDVRPGQVTGVLGGTGAGKSTLLRRMVELDRGGGETLFDGRPYRSLRHPMREVGLLLESRVGHPERTVRGHLRLALATDRRAAREGGVAGARRSGPVAAEDPITVANSWHGLTEPGEPGLETGVETGIESGRWQRAVGRLFASRKSIATRIDAVLDIVGLTGQSETRLADLTDGMATRLGIAVALLGDPKALLFDCPERGLEPEGVAWLGALLRAFTGQGRAALITGSDTETLVGLADRVLLLDSGYLMGTRTAEEVLRAPTGAAVIVRSPQIVRFAAILAEAGARSAQGEGACLEVRGLDRARVGDLAYRHGIPVHELSERFTGSDPADVVLAACSGRNKPVVPFQGFPDLENGPDALAGIGLYAGDSLNEFSAQPANVAPHAHAVEARELLHAADAVGGASTGRAIDLPDAAVGSVSVPTAPVDVAFSKADSVDAASVDMDTASDTATASAGGFTRDAASVGDGKPEVAIGALRAVEANR